MRRYSLLVAGAITLISLGFLTDLRAQGARETDSSAQSPPSADVPAEPSVTILGSRQAQSVLGKEVRSSADENMGRIVDVIVDHAGRVRAAIIDFGGFSASAAARSPSTGTRCALLRPMPIAMLSRSS